MSANLDAFLLDCKLRGLSNRTIETYKIRITQIEHVTQSTDNRLALIKALESYPNVRTRHQAFRCIKTYVRWLAVNDLSDDWITGMKLKFGTAPVPVPLSADEVGRIVAAIPVKCRRKDRSLVGKRDRALFTLLYYSGCRRDAIRLLKREDIDSEGQTIRITTKGDKEFIKHLPKVAALELNRWMIHNPSEVWAFPSITRPDRAICAHYVSHALPRYALKAGITRRVWVHLLRHSHAGAMAAAGVPVDVIQYDLGHSSINTTMKYVHQLTAAKRVRDAIDSVFK